MKVEQIIKCDICEGTAELKKENLPGYQEPDTFKIYSCSSCDTSFALPRIVTNSLYENIYKNGDKVPGYDRYWSYLNNIKKVGNPLNYLAGKEDTYWGVKEALSLTVKNKKATRILEIGSGLGYLTYSLIKSDYEVTGLDISQTAVDRANETFGRYYKCADLFEFTRENKASFDIVILTEVIEHVDDPLGFIKAIKELLKPGGSAIITTPNKSFYPPDINWVGDLPAVHLWWFSEKSMKHIAARTGFELSLINFKAFYKKNYRAVDLNIFRSGILLQPTLNNNGELIPGMNGSKANKSALRLMLVKLPGLKKLYNLVKDRINKDVIFCGDRGMVICAILKKN